MLSKNRNIVIDFNRKKMRPVVDSSVTNYMELLNANSYQKGGWVLHMLRRQLGDPVFWKGIQTYYNRYAGKNAVTADLCKVMEEVSGQSLKQFFHQWLFTAGHPKLDLQWKYDARKKEIDITVIQLQKDLYQFPLELQFGKEPTQKVSIKDRESRFTIPVSGKPATVTADPGMNLLFEGSVKEMK
jgi:aminopeptidase N